MTAPRTVTLYLDPDLRRSAEAGQHNFMARMTGVLRAAGYAIGYGDPAAAVPDDGYSIFHMAPPFATRSVTFRRVYHYPFWAIERSEKRWEWAVSRATFDPALQPRKEADRFHGYWRKRLFGEAAQTATREGFVYVPLQGRLLHHRSFQSCAPVDMVEYLLAYEPKRRIVAALHPKETYGPGELTALEDLARRFPRLTVETGQMERWLAGCDYVVTENSSAAFSGYFLGKPAVLFARIDFHHIALKAAELGPEAAIRAAPDAAPDYAAYLHWFWQQMSINAGRPEADARIARKFIQAGWPMDRSGGLRSSR